MTTATAPTFTPAPPRKASVLAALGSRYSVEPDKLLDTLKQTAFKGATDAQMVSLCIVANQYGLNPFTREIYAFPDSKSGGIVPVIGVDGWMRIANDHPQFDGCEFAFTDDAATCRIYRKDRSRPVEVTEFLAECRRKTAPWDTSPKRMLRHRAFIQAARLAFGISALDPEDAERVAEAPAVEVSRPRFLNLSAPEADTAPDPGVRAEPAARAPSGAVDAPATAPAAPPESDLPDYTVLSARLKAAKIDTKTALKGLKHWGEYSHLSEVPPSTVADVMDDWAAFLGFCEGGSAE